jgi:hypothetical protein
VACVAFIVGVLSVRWYMLCCLQLCKGGRGRAGGFYCFMAVRGFKMASKSLLGKIVCSSFRWLSLRVYRIYVESLNCVQVCSFVLEFQYLHCVVNGAEGVFLFDKVLSEF